MDPAQIQPGYRLDSETRQTHYELLCPLAYGGMASVWLARSAAPAERLVVVKMILPQYSQDPRFQEMFLDESRIASKIEHPNVARILDVGHHEDNMFMVMEWVDGDSLSKIIRGAEAKKMPIPLGVALRISADAAAGLHAAHALKHDDGTLLGVVHRDVSPQNILVSNAGATMIIDFGVAKAKGRVSQDTSAGQLKGKIRYMAPEQALGRSIDHRADIWALGSTLYELMTGDPPFDGANEIVTLHKLTSGQPAPPLPSSVPAQVRSIIDRALTYEAPMRFATALEMSLALEEAMIAIGEPADTAVVAAFTSRLLDDRKTARRRAVEQALTQAQARAGGAAPIPLHLMMPTPRADLGQRRPSARPGGADDLALSATRNRLEAPAWGPQVALGAPEIPAFGRSPSLHELPSSATLGSAAMEYPPGEPGASRRTWVNGALAAALLACLVGTVLIAKAAFPGPTPASSGDGSQTTDSPQVTQAQVATPTEVAPPPAATAIPNLPGPASPTPSATAPETTPGEPPVGLSTPTRPVRPTTIKNPDKAPPAPPPKKKDYGF